MKPNYKLLTIIFLLLTLLLGGLQIHQFNKNASLVKENTHLTDSLTKVNVITNNLNQKIYTQEAQITNSQAAIKELTAAAFNTSKKHEKEIKEINAYYTAKLKAKLPPTILPYVDTAKLKELWTKEVLENCKSVIEYYEDSTVLIGTVAEDSTKDYNLSVTVERNGISINRLELVDTQYIRFITTKPGILKRDVNGKLKLFKKKQIAVEVLHTNPYFTVEKSQTVYYSEPNRHPFFKGVGLGVLLTTGIIILTH